jgi:hypothetical protein
MNSVNSVNGANRTSAVSVCENVNSVAEWVYMAVHTVHGVCNRTEQFERLAGV